MQHTLHPVRADTRPKANHLADEKKRRLPDAHTPLARQDTPHLLPTPSPITTLFRHHSRRMLSAIACITIFLFLTAADCGLGPILQDEPTHSYVRSVQQYARAVSSPLLEVFQIYPPVLTVAPDGTLEITDGSSNASVEVVPSRRPTCQEKLVVYSFGASYGQPYVGDYTPPACSFNRVSWNLTVTSSGRQFDRLGSVSFGDIELFRTSTAEPTQTGIEWTYIKVRIRAMAAKTSD